jgi:hypothetical protein
MTAIQTRSILVDLDTHGGLVAVPQRRRDAVLARLFGRSLDGRLAAGASPESTRLLAVRAMHITSPRMRLRLARCWDELAARSRRPHPLGDPRAPIVRWQVDAAADEIQQVADVLRADRPVSAQGVAIATVLLTSAESPVYRIGSGRDDVAAAIVRALTQM